MTEVFRQAAAAANHVANRVVEMKMKAESALPMMPSSRHGRIRPSFRKSLLTQSSLQPDPAKKLDLNIDFLHHERIAAKQRQNFLNLAEQAPAKRLVGHSLHNLVGYNFLGASDDDNGHMIECIAAARWRLFFASS